MFNCDFLRELELSITEKIDGNSPDNLKKKHPRIKKIISDGKR